MNVTPSFPRLDAADGVFSDTIFRSNFALKPRIGANNQHLRFGQLGRSALLSAIGGAMFNAIQLIVARCVPAQIFKAIIKGIAIVVASLHAWRPWADKSLKHRLMRINDAKFVFSPQSDKRAAFLPIMRVRLNFARTRIANTPSIRNLIQPFVTNNVFPRFHTSSHLAHMGMLP